MREDHDLTQAEIAAELHVAQRTYSHYECGSHMVPPEIICALARFYGVSTDYLLGLTDIKRPYPPARQLPQLLDQEVP